MVAWRSKIYLVGTQAAELVPMEETAYAAEDVLQERLARYPDLLPGDQINPEVPRRWLLVAREMAVPGEESGNGRWSLDHLFPDQDGIPTFVECKRAGDTRARREVVAQMLDYAANGTAYWPLDRLRQAAAETAGRASRTLDEQIRDLLRGNSEEDKDGVDAFWGLVEDNLRAGRVRLVFVADEIPRDLRRLVEFLNEKMQDLEVLAVEVKQFVGQHHTAIVPRVVGLTESARAGKTQVARPATLDLGTFLARCSPAIGDVFQYIHDTSLARGHRFNWGPTRFSLRATAAGRDFTFGYCYPGSTIGKLEIYLDSSCPAPVEVVADVRSAVLATGLFKPAGQYTLAAPVTYANVTAIRSAFDMVLDRVAGLVATVAATA